MDKALEERVLCQDGPITVIAVMMADHHTTADDRDYDTPEHERDYRARYEAREFDYVRMVIRVEVNGVCVHTATVYGVEHGTVAENREADAWELTPYQCLANGAYQMSSPLSGV
ncbi:MAG TPA: hypothetical protein VE196_03300, partial [Pseudonocardiaceae bacterium]|nr:hypothetical protein [Pseudonocardiaceae bacterium]